MIKKFILILLFSLVSTTYLRAQTEDPEIPVEPDPETPEVEIILPETLEETLELGLRVVDIYTIDEEEPWCSPIYPPEGSLGISITDANKVPGRVTVYMPDGSVLYESGEYVAKESGMTIKVRGNTSAAFTEKKPYKIKLQKKGDMLGRGDKKYNDKNWVLVKSEDLTFYLATEIAMMMGQSWEPAFEFVNVRVNGDYRGLYCLAEGVERNEQCRVNVSEDGFILENDPYWWNENGEYLLSEEWNPRFNFTFKYPDYEDALPEQLELMQDIIKRYETSINDGTYSETIDVNSFANWILTHDILGTSDGGGVNWYICKNSIYDDSLITCGPLWDLNTSFQLTEMFSGAHRDPFRKYFTHPQMVNFRRVYVARWEEVKDRMKESIETLIENLNTPDWDVYDLSVQYNNTRWTIPEMTSKEVYEWLQEWTCKRFEWLDNAIANLDVAATVPEKFSLSHSHADLWVRDRLQIDADVWPAYSHDKRVYWQTYDSRVASVTQDGLVEANDVGETEIWAWPVANPSLAVKCHIAVHFLYASEISLDQSRISTQTGDVFTLTASVVPENATDPGVDWMSNDPTVATVEDGRVEVCGPGKCFIFALTTDGSNKLAWCKVEAVLAGTDGVWVTPGAGVEVYTVSGLLVGRNVTPEEFETLPKGIYIVNGVKICK